jgi:hypothetical protein
MEYRHSLGAEINLIMTGGLGRVYVTVRSKHSLEDVAQLREWAQDIARRDWGLPTPAIVFEREE